MNGNFTLTPVYGGGFVGRKDVISEILNEIKNPKTHTGFCLHGRRRVGKTSLLRELEYELSRDKTIVVAYLSLFELADLSLPTFTKHLSTVVLEAYRKKKILPLEFTVRTLMESPGEVIDSALSKIKVGAELSEELKFFLEFKSRKTENHNDIVLRAFNLGEKLAAASKTSFILILDEFPEILEIENGIQLVKMFRSLHEKQKRTTILISGSEKRTMELVALGAASPFYKQLVPIKIHPFSIEETVEFVRSYGLRLNKEQTVRLYELTGGVPFYLQSLGRSGEILTNVDAAIINFVNEEGNIFFKEEFQRLSIRERRIVVSMANGAMNPTGISESSGEPVTSVSHYLIRLQEKEVVRKTGKARYALVDTLFSFWLRVRYG